MRARVGRLVPGCLVLVLILGSVAPVASAQGYPDTGPLMAAQREALAKLAFLDGTWRGTARTLLPDGTWHEFTQTERVGPMLDGGVRVIEGRGYEADGSVYFNAFAVVSYDVGKQAYQLRSYARGFVGDFELRLTDDGFAWTIPAGPMTMEYRATVQDGVWREVGDRVIPGQEPVRFIEMEMRRTGDTDWPAAGAVGPE